MAARNSFLGAAMNKLFYGDNLDVLRRHIASESIDLIYLDPPFQSGRDYNVLFEDMEGIEATAQFKLSKILGLGTSAQLRHMMR